MNDTAAQNGPLHCRRVCRLIPLYIAKAPGLSAEQIGALEAHLDACPRCRQGPAQTKSPWV